MQYEFLKNFPKRMKNVGLYATLVQNTVSKTSWNKYYISKSDEQINIVFSVLLFIMENSLREDSCTLDDIAAFVDNVNSSYYNKPLSYDECRELGDFIVNSILSNDGKLMTFDGYDYEQKAYHIIHIRYVMNKVIYVQGDVKRTSYMLTDDGYNLLLATLEVESNLRLTIQEMIFQMHLEKQSYDKAVDDIKEIFNRMRIQLQKIREAMVRIRRNALNYSVTEYEEILHENLDTIADTKDKFERYRQLVDERTNELEEADITVEKLSKEEEEKLANLKVISSYLGRTIDEHQKILNDHFELKALYTKELEDLSQVSMIKRFSLRSEVYEKILERPCALGNFPVLISALFHQDVQRQYNIKKACQLQRPSRLKQEEETTEEIEFDEAAWEEEQERIRQEKRKQYETCLGYILERVLEQGELTLSKLQTEGEQEKLIPSLGVFKEVMVELIKSRHLDIAALKQERSVTIEDSTEIFEPNIMILELLETLDPEGVVEEIYITKQEDDKVVFEHIVTEEGEKTIRCSNVTFLVHKGNEKSV